MAVPDDKATLKLGSTRVPMQVLTDDKGTLQWFMDDRTASEQDELVWEAKDFLGGPGKNVAPQGEFNRLLYNLNTELTREGTLVVGRNVAYEKQAGSLWTAHTGTWVTTNSGASHTVGLATTGIATVAGTTTVVAETRVSQTATGVSGIVFRYADASNYWRAVIDVAALHMVLTKRVAGVETVVKDVALPGALGTWARLRVTVDSSSNIKVFFDGAQAGTTATDTDLSANVRTGLYNGNTQAVSFDWFVLQGYIYDEFVETTGASLANHTPGFGSRVLRYMVHSGTLLCVTRLNIFYRSAADSYWVHRYFVDTDTAQGRAFRDIFAFGANVFATRDTAIYAYANSSDTYLAWTESSLSFNAHHMTRLRSVAWAVGSDRTVRSTADPTNSGAWTTQDTLADASTSITAESIATWGDLVLVGLSDGVYVEDANGDTYHMTPEVRGIVATGNTRWMTVFDGGLVVPTYKGGLLFYRAPGEKPEDISPSTFFPMLPDFNQGIVTINGLTADSNWLYAHVYTTVAQSATRYQHILRGRFEGAVWRWEDIYYIAQPGTINAVTGSNASAGLGLSSLVGNDVRLYWGNDENSTVDVRGLYVVFSHNANYIDTSMPSLTQNGSPEVITPHLVAVAPKRLFRLHRMDVHMQTTTGSVVPYYATNVQGGNPLAYSWTQFKDGAGNAVTISASGITSVYFASGTYARAVAIRLVIGNVGTGLDTVVEGISVYGRARTTGLYSIRFVAAIASSMLGTLQRMMAPSTATVQTNLAALRDAVSGQPQLHGPDGATYDVDVVSVNVKGLRLRQTPKVGHDYLVEVVAQEVRVLTTAWS